MSFDSISPPHRVPLAELRLILRRIANAVLTLTVIAYLTSFVLILAERGRAHLPANVLTAATQSFVRIWELVFAHPQTYFWQKVNTPAFGLVVNTLGKSAGLLAISLGVALVIGIGLGASAAVSKRKFISSLIVMFSTLGVSTPSFLLGMLFWILNIQVHRSFDIPVLPAVGFGWDAHLVMPVLVLAMRPLAQISQVTYITLTEIFKQDYIRTAQSKGLIPRLIFLRHALKNALIPILTTLGTSLRFSLASLPVVELFFNWPGIGLTLIQAVDKGMSTFVIDLILSLGVFFLLVNLVIEILFPLIDVRMRNTESETDSREPASFSSVMTALGQGVRDWIINLRNVFSHKVSHLPPLPVTETKLEKPEKELLRRNKYIIPAILKNPSLIIGFIVVLGLAFLAFFGGKLTDTNPYMTHNVLVIEGVIQGSPFAPSSVFPWGSDNIGRDIQALVLNGSRQTLSLVLFGMLARILLGGLLGILAGWWQGSRLDRLISGGIGVWAAFPVTLFAMLVIQGLGIQQGMWVFVFTISVVGWGEVAQMVRSQVISIKIQPYIESAHSVGAGSMQILVRQVLPNLIDSLIVMAVLEMGGILMLLAELGYLNIFLGGGFAAMIGEVGYAQPLIVRYSDVPEWAALIANIRSWWRSYPWMALYPGLAFFISIMAFNLTGEGLRRFLAESRLNISRLFNRYTLLAGLATVVVFSLLLQANAPLGVYKSEGFNVDATRVMKDIEVLSSAAYQGRETGTAGADLAAQYIAQRMEEVGLIPAGEKNTFFQTQVNPRRHLLSIPTLTIENDPGTYVYRRDFSEIAGVNRFGEAQAPIVGVAFGVLSNDDRKTDPYGLIQMTRNNILVVRATDFGKIPWGAALGVLVIEDEQYTIERKDLIPYQAPGNYGNHGVPTMVIKRALADQMLATAGSSVAALDERAGSLGINQVSITAEGARVHMNVDARFPEDITSEKYINVLGVIPGEGHFMGTEDHVIFVSAYYDGLGVGPDGTLYPGANDNASAVALLLELARVLKASAYKPEKGVIFAVWAGGERGDGLSVVNTLNARPGAGGFTVEAVIELSGVGYGSGNSIALQETSSYRLVKLFQAAAGKYNIPTTTRGRNPHYGSALALGFGDRTALTLSISWDGSDDLAHTPRDLPEIIDPQKLEKVGRSTLLTILVLCREINY